MPNLRAHKFDGEESSYSGAYLPGASDAVFELMKRGDGAAKSHNLADLPHLPNASFGTLIQGVDECYREVRSARLDVSVCVEWTLDGINGKSEKERADLLNEYRQYEAKVSSAQ